MLTIGVQPLDRLIGLTRRLCYMTIAGMADTITSKGVCGVTVRCQWQSYQTLPFEQTAETQAAGSAEVYRGEEPL